MFKISHILAGALAAAALMAADWATAAPLSLSHNVYAYSRADQMGPVDERPSRATSARAIPPPGRRLQRQRSARHDHHRYAEHVPLSRAARRPRDPLRHRRRPRRLPLVRRAAHHQEGRVAGLDAARRNDPAPAYLPRFMAGGATNPLGARAMYLGNTVYRIHGTNAPSTIGQRVSSGCIRLTNEDVIDLASRVNVGTKVVVINHDYRADSPARPMISVPASMQLR
jgi:hypothetical protein